LGSEPVALNYISSLRFDARKKKIGPLDKGTLSEQNDSPDF